MIHLVVVKELSNHTVILKTCSSTSFHGVVVALMSIYLANFKYSLTFREKKLICFRVGISITLTALLCLQDKFVAAVRKHAQNGGGQIQLPAILMLTT